MKGPPRSIAPQRRRRSPDRRGLAILIVLVCLLLVTMIGASLLRVASLQRRQVGHEELRRQAIWLAESAIGRAAAKLSADPAFAGETWELASSDLDRRRAGRVTIVVTADQTRPNRRLVAVTAEFPRDGDRRARVSKRLHVDLPAASGDNRPSGDDR